MAKHTVYYGFHRLGPLATDNSGKSDVVWRQEPDPSIGGRRWVWSAGRMLGSSSSINGQVYMRGTRHDFDSWAEQGATGWRFDEVFPYFLRSEHWHGALSQAHGSSGPLSVSPIRDPHSLCDTFLEAFGEAGLPTLSEYNGGKNFGAFLTQTNQRDGWRCGTDVGYLRPIHKRANLRVLAHADVRAVGVTLVRGGNEQQIDARRQVLVSAGAIGSPALLMRSGIAPAGHPRERGIAMVCASAGVGGNLQEHSGIGASRFVTVPTLNTLMGPLDMVGHFARFLWNRSGPLSAPAVQAMGLAKTRGRSRRTRRAIASLPARIGHRGGHGLACRCGHGQGGGGDDPRLAVPAARPRSGRVGR